MTLLLRSALSERRLNGRSQTMSNCDGCSRTEPMFAPRGPGGMLWILRPVSSRDREKFEIGKSCNGKSKSGNLKLDSRPAIGSSNLRFPLLDFPLQDFPISKFPYPWMRLAYSTTPAFAIPVG